jgi:hypothetical protein
VSRYRRKEDVQKISYAGDRRGKMIYLQKPTVCVKVISAKQMHLPESIRSIHAYSPESGRVGKYIMMQKLKNLPKHHSLKTKLYKRQKGARRAMSSVPTESVFTV